MTEFRMPVPLSYLREIIRDKARKVTAERHKKEQGLAYKDFAFTMQDAILDIMLAKDKDDVKPYRYYAKKWGWKESTTYKRLPGIIESAAEWRNFPKKAKVSTKEAKSKQRVSKKSPLSTIQKGKVSAKEAQSKQEVSREEHTTYSYYNEKESDFVTKEKDDTHTNTGSENNFKRFVKPKPDQLVEYFASWSSGRGLAIDAKLQGEKFFDFYESKGWRVGKTGMKDWKAAVRNWLRDVQPKAASQYGVKRSTQPERTYDGTNDPEYKQFYLD